MVHLDPTVVKQCFLSPKLSGIVVRRLSLDMIGLQPNGMLIWLLTWRLREKCRMRSPPPKVGLACFRIKVLATAIPDVFTTRTVVLIKPPLIGSISHDVPGNTDSR